MSDEELMLLFCRSRDQEAFAELVLRYEAEVQHILGRFGDEHLAADLTQETFLAVFQFPEKYDASRRFNVWLVSIALNTAIDYSREQTRQCRDRSRDQTIFTRNGTVDIAQPDPLAKVIDCDGLRQLVSRLPRDERAMVEGVYLNQKTWQEAADEAGVLKSSSHHVLNRGLGRLREWLTGDAELTAA